MENSTQDSYSGPVEFSANDEVIQENGSPSEQLDWQRRQRFGILKFLQSLLLRRKTREMKKVERILRGSDCRELIQKCFGSITPGLLENILALEEQRGWTTISLTPHRVLEEERGTLMRNVEFMKHTLEKKIRMK